jgi:hypothetical protein
MSHPRKPREGYGSTSESRQRVLTNDHFREGQAQTPEEMDDARTLPEDGGKVVQVDTLGEPIELPRTDPTDEE